MENGWNGIIWRQFGAAIDMLESAVNACPDRIWANRTLRPEYWYVAYHTIFFLDYYMSESEAGFAPPAPFTLTELDPAGVLPDRVYTRPELLDYLEHGRRKCRAAVEALTEERGLKPCGFGRRNLTVTELYLYSMRHVQHHAAQLYMLLRQTTDSAPEWVSQAKG